MKQKRENEKLSFKNEVLTSEETKQGSRRGGARPNAGRKPLAEPRKMRPVCFTDKEWETIREEANRQSISASEFIRSRVLND